MPTTELPETTTLLLSEMDGVLGVTLNRPQRKNALSALMVSELTNVFTAFGKRAGVRAIVLRGAGQTFCAGADVKDMQERATSGPQSQQSPPEQQRAIAVENRKIGGLLLAVDAAECPVITVVEGAVLGGGIGLVCASDVTLAAQDARFGLPETGLGVVPAQIAPFVVQRIGFAHARRLMLTGARLTAEVAERLGLVHAVYADAELLEAGLTETLTAIRRCAPGANARTKRLLFAQRQLEAAAALDLAAQVFAEAAVSEEAHEGRSAFLEKRPPRWAQ